jgi:integrase
VLCSGNTNSKTYVVQRDVNGKARRCTVGACNELTLEQARAAAADLLHDMRRGIDPKRKVVVPTLQAALEAYLQARSGLAPGSVRMYRTIERTLQPWLDLPLHQITPEMVETKHRDLVGVNPNYKGEATANFAMKTLGIVYGFAEERHADMPPNPVRRLKQQWYKQSRRTRKVKADDLPRFYAAVQALAKPVSRDWILLLLFTGLRRNEAASMRWDNVDFTERMIRLPVAVTKA